jgi:hypothetical protein
MTQVFLKGFKSQNTVVEYFGDMKENLKKSETNTSREIASKSPYQFKLASTFQDAMMRFIASSYLDPAKNPNDELFIQNLKQLSCCYIKINEEKKMLVAINNKHSSVFGHFFEVNLEKYMKKLHWTSDNKNQFNHLVLNNSIHFYDNKMSPLTMSKKIRNVVRI